MNTCLLLLPSFVLVSIFSITYFIPFDPLQGHLQQHQASAQTQLEPPQAMDIRTKTSANTPVIIEFQVKDSNPDSQLTVSIVSSPANGKLGDIDQTARTVTYIPSPNFTGHDSFTYKVNNGKVDSNTATISVNIYPQHSPQSKGQAAELGPSKLPNTTSAGNITSESRNYQTRQQSQVIHP